MQSERVEVWSDGACKGNPGPGGWGALIRVNGRPDVELSGGDPATTNNRMELLAVVQALRSLPDGTRVTVHTDSTYVLNGITKWLAGWRRNGWLTGGKQPVKNVDLWQDLDEQAARHTVGWVWVKGHAGDPGNERADALANAAVPGGMGDGSAGDGRPARERTTGRQVQARGTDRPARTGGIAARYAGRCPRCSRAITKGDRIHQSDGLWVCEACAVAA